MATTTWKPHTKHGDLTTRSDLPDSVYAFPKQRKEPLTDAAHVRNALVGDRLKCRVQPDALLQESLVGPAAEGIHARKNVREVAVVEVPLLQRRLRVDTDDALAVGRRRYDGADRRPVDVVFRHHRLLVQRRRVRAAGE